MWTFSNFRKGTPQNQLCVTEQLTCGETGSICQRFGFGCSRDLVAGHCRMGMLDILYRMWEVYITANATVVQLAPCYEVGFAVI